MTNTAARRPCEFVESGCIVAVDRILTMALMCHVAMVVVSLSLFFGGGNLRKKVST